MNFSREVKTAILIISCILIFIFGFSYLKGTSLLNSEKLVHALYQDVEGLVVGANITVSGLNVGKVKYIDFDDNFEKIKVTFSLREDLTFSNQSVAQLYEAGLIGGKAIAILPKYDSASVVKNGDILPSEIKPGLTDLVNQRLTPLQQKIEKVMESTDVLLANINSVFDEKTKSNIRGSFSQLEQTIASFESTSNALNALLQDNKTSITTTLDNFSNISENLSEVSSNLAEADLKQTINELQSTISNFDQLLKNIEKGEGSIGKLMKDEGLYNNLEGALGQMEALLEDMKLNPKRYVHFSLFGKKPKPYSTDDSNNKSK